MTGGTAALSVPGVVALVELHDRRHLERFDCPLCHSEQTLLVNADRSFYCLGCGAKRAVA
jgi:ribosomal protein S27E